MTQVGKKIEWCLRKAEQEGKRHKGLKKGPINKEKVKEHLEKAKRNLILIDHLIEINYSDWAVSAIFYSMYHCLLAILLETWLREQESSLYVCCH